MKTTYPVPQKQHGNFHKPF